MTESTLPQQSASRPESRQERRRHIVIIGAGPGGMCMAIKLLEAGFEDFVILERQSEPGGTWTNNRYPGLACDVPSLLYSFSFEQKVDWSRIYATQPEIKAYMLRLAEKYGLRRFMRFDTEVERADWDDNQCHWVIRTKSGSDLVASVLISGLGMFNEVVTPDIPGIETFTGTSFHTARWPDDVVLRDQSVSVIGSAASAVQMIPEIAKQARHLTVYQRTPNWVMPKDDRAYSDEELSEFRRNPAVALGIRAEYVDKYEALLTFDKPDIMQELRSQALQNLAQVEDSEVRAKLTATVPLGAQRPLFSNEYYPTFNRPDVELVTESIDEIVPSGIRTAGTVRPCDVIIFATGYAANKYLSVIDVRGRDGIALAQAWEDGPQAYLGVTTQGFPNLFMLYGPNTNNGSILTMLEYQVEYIIRRLLEMKRHALHWIDVRRSVMDTYNDIVQKDIHAVEPWRTLGTRYYRARSGRIVTQWPSTMAAFKARCEASGLEDFETAGA